jgi:hypothetical protein
MEYFFNQENEIILVMKNISVRGLSLKKIHKHINQLLGQPPSQLRII